MNEKIVCIGNKKAEELIAYLICSKGVPVKRAKFQKCFGQSQQKIKQWIAYIRFADISGKVVLIFQ